MKPIKCKNCGFSLELVEIRSNLELYRCSTCGKQETVEILPKIAESEEDVSNI
jgi:uncharacterized Zn finger protein